MALYNYMTPEKFNKQGQFNPNMGPQSTGTQKKSFMTRAKPFIDVLQPVVGLAANAIAPGSGTAINAGIDVAQQIGQGQQNKMDQQYANQIQMQQQDYDFGDTGIDTNFQRNLINDEDLLNQGEQRINNSQSQNPYGMANGGKKKTMMQRMVDDMAFNNSNNYGGMANGGLKRSEDYGSKAKPYPSVQGKDFAGAGRSYPIPTRADAVDALRLAGLHGNNAVKAKVHAKYPGLKSGGTHWNADTGPYGHGGNYGMIPGNGNSKADDKPVDMKDGSYVIPNDTNSKDDPKISIAKSLLAFLGHDSDKKFAMNGGSQSNVNISSKEMVLNPKQSDQFDQAMGGEMNKEAFFTPNSEFNNALPGTHQMPDGSMMADAMMNKGGKKGLMNMCYQDGGTYAERMKAEGDAMTDEEMNAIVNAPAEDVPYGDILEQNKSIRQMPNYLGEEITHQVNTQSPDYYNPATGMTNQQTQDTEYQKKIDDEGYYNMLANKLKSGQTLTPEEQADYDFDATKANQPTPTTTTPTAEQTPGAEDPFAEANRLNRVVSGLEAGATVGIGLYNLLTKYKPGQKPLEYAPDIKERDFMGLQNDLDKQTQLAGSTARYNARNVNQTPLMNASIHANELQQLNKNAAAIHDLQEQDKLRVNDERNKANLYNLANMNQYNAKEAEQLNAFRIQKGQVLSDNLSTLSEIGKDYLSNKVLIDTAQRGTKIDTAYKSYMDFKNYEKMKDPNNPIVKKNAEGKIIYRKDANGNATDVPEYFTFEEYLAKNKL